MRRFILALSLIVTSVQLGTAYSFSGDPSADGWQSWGNSLNTSSVIYATGTTSTFSFNAYSFSFNLGVGDSSSSSIGSPSGSLLGGSWQAGDLIIGLGARIFGGAGTSGFYYKLDFAGTSSWTPAGSVGGPGGNSGSTTGNLKGGVVAFQHPHTYLTPQAHRYTDGSGSQFVVGTSGVINFASELRSWSTLDAGNPGSGQGLRAVSSEMLFNYSALQRMGIPVAGLGKMKAVIGVYGQNEGQDVVLGAGGQNLQAVPEPATIAFGLVASLAAFSKLRRTKAINALG